MTITLNDFDLSQVEQWRQSQIQFLRRPSVGGALMAKFYEQADVATLIRCMLVNARASTDDANAGSNVRIDRKRALLAAATKSIAEKATA